MKLKKSFALFLIICFQQLAAQTHQQFLQQFVPHGSLVFDIGACIGTKVDRYLQAGAKKVIAVDPQPGCYCYMQKKYATENRVTVVPVGIADVQGTATMAICDNTMQLSTLSQEWKENSRYRQMHRDTWNKTIEVPVITLDQLIAQYGIPYFCKIDVENFEYEVIKGLSQPTAYLCFEFHKVDIFHEELLVNATFV